MLSLCKLSNQTDSNSYKGQISKPYNSTARNGKTVRRKTENLSFFPYRFTTITSITSLTHSHDSLTHRQRYNEDVLCAKKNKGDEFTCQQKKLDAYSIFPDDCWVGLEGLRSVNSSCIISDLINCCVVIICTADTALFSSMSSAFQQVEV